jgi:hypothetical protein
VNRRPHSAEPFAPATSRRLQPAVTVSFAVELLGVQG